jgi:preprotein translocase subunit SecG
MLIALTIVHVLACFAIIGIVLLQSGKGADIGSAFGGAGSQAVFGSMGTPTLLGKITTGIAIVFTITSFTLAILGGERATSVIREAAPPPATAPAPAAPTPAAPAAPATPAPAAPASPAPPNPTR